MLENRVTEGVDDCLLRSAGVSNLRLAFLIGAFLLSLYILTMGGHTSSPDEEGMFYVAQSIVSAGTFSIPANYPGTGTTLMKGESGRLYSPSGFANSVMEAPFVALGHAIANIYPAKYRSFITRLVTNLLDPLVTALTAVTLFFVCLELGYSPRVATALSAAFGISTIAWPYSKYLWSEPVTTFWLLLSVLLLLHGARDRSWVWELGSGLCIGWSIASKVATGIALIGFAVYFMLTLYQSLRSASVLTKVITVIVKIAAFGVGCLIMLLMIGLYDYVRFGSMVATGYGQPPFNFLQIHGLEGLLVSPGKSIFIYSPLLILAIPGLAYFTRRRLKEATLITLIFLSQLFLYGAFVAWHGDAAWGPRYLVPITALLLLPIGSLIVEARGIWSYIVRGAFVVLAAAGVLVQLGGVLVNYNTYTISTGGSFGPLAHNRRWVPADSPVLQHWNILFAHFATWRRYLSDSVDLGKGFYPSQGKDGALFPRWTDGSASFTIRLDGSSPVRIDVEYLDHRPSKIGPSDPTLLVDGKSVPATNVKVSMSSDWHYPNRITATLPSSWIHSGETTVTIASRPWVPAKVIPGSADSRTLGVFIASLQVMSSDSVLPIRSAPVAPLPVSASSPWSKAAWAWFYDPRNAHLADTWEWYWYVSGLPRTVLLITIVPLAGLVVSGYSLVVSWRRLAVLPLASESGVPLLVIK